jgi:hypothetical protein
MSQVSNQQQAHSKHSLLFDPDNGGSTFLQNAGELQLNHTPEDSIPQTWVRLPVNNLFEQSKNDQFGK